ncbi:unnamed protein product [Callosobruchus maculatus]|uniref:Uncharacterized protein n=1 Tax=Callosobruchus maculatus TaxID=64391 RepID=A0A653DTD8_CALMS|nr:unnamed protein product [Callosobruchus maculatus]
MLYTMHLSQVLAVFGLVIAAARSGTAFDAFGYGADNLARGAAAATAGAAGATAGALELKKGLLIKEALIKMIKAKLTASGIIGNEVVKDVAYDKAYGGRYAPVATVAVPAVPVVAGAYYDRGYKADTVAAGAAAAGAAAAKTKGLIALLASLGM